MTNLNQTTENFSKVINCQMFRFKIADLMYYHQKYMFVLQDFIATVGLLF